MEQINTYTQQRPQHNNQGGVSDMEKLQLKEMVSDYMNHNEINKRVRNLVNQTNSKNVRFNINMDELREFNPRLANYVTQDPLSAIKMFQDQLNQNAKSLKEEGSSSSKVSNEKLAAAQDSFPKKTQVYYVNFEGNFGKRHITPRGLRAELMNQYVQVSGIVTRMSIVKPIIHTSVHYCEETKRGHIYNYDDANDLNHLARKLDEEESAFAEQNNGFKTQDNNGNPLSAEYGYCVYKDQQTIVIQEMPERTPPGQLPRSIEVILEDDLVDKCKPGDRISVTGVFRAKLHEGRQNAITKNFLIATGLQQINHDKEKPNLTEADIKNIRKLAKDEKLFDILGNSIASTIEGLHNIKKGLLLQLLGGAEKNLETGTHLRGDINILMVGDPSTAKSQLLRHIMDIAPLAINTTGRGSTGVGLTAAVTCDKDTGEKHLEAGAMVLADRGVVCIDEFDKMNDLDRVAIHEVMEQQTVTIAKAGIHVSLNARCSVIAAANPIYGDYARDAPVGKNIGMPDSLLSRFDLLFVVLDEKDADNDRKIAERVIANHRYQAPHQINELASVFNYTNDDVVVEHDFNTDKKLTQGGKKDDTIFEKTFQGQGNQLASVTRDFLKKYLSYAKAQKQPELSPESIEQAAQFYSMIRTKALNYDQSRVSVPITVRTLETMIRLATAHSKLRLSKHVEPKDVEIAVGLLNESIFQEVKEEKEVEEDEDILQDEVVDADGDMEMMDAAEEELLKKNAANSRTERYAKRSNNQGVKFLDMQSPSKENQQPNNNSNGTRSTRQSEANKRQQQQSPYALDKIEGSRPSKRVKIDDMIDASGVKNLFNAKQSTNTNNNSQTNTRSSKVLTTTKIEQQQQQTQAPVQVKQEVKLEAQNTLPPATVDQKRYLYKLISENKGADTQISVDKLWKAFMMAPETEAYKKGKPLISSKQHMVGVVQELENDTLVMYSAEDGQIVLI